jgi:hypothetical protein
LVTGDDAFTAFTAGGDRSRGKVSAISKGEAPHKNGVLEEREREREREKIADPPWWCFGFVCGRCA